MANKKILLYLKEGLKRGHSISSLQKALVKQGVKASELNNAIKELNISTPSKNKVPTKTILIIIVLAIVIGTTFYFKESLINLTASVEEKGDESEPQIAISDPQCMSILKEDVSYCNKQQLESTYEKLDLKIECRNEFFFAQALMKKDSSICNNIETEESTKSSCLAAAKKDSSLCQDIANTNDRITCEAGAKQDVAVCEKISDLFYKADCVDSVNYNLAILLNDKSYCEKITIEGPMKYGCLAAITKDKSLCELAGKEVKIE